MHLKLWFQKPFHYQMNCQHILVAESQLQAFTANVQYDDVHLHASFRIFIYIVQ